MKRIGLPVFIVVLTLALLTFFIFQVAGKTDPLTLGSKIISFILSLLQIGVIILIAVVAVIYILSRKYYYVFKGFSNASALPSLEKRPLDLDILAREELVHQLKLLYQDWTSFSGHRGLDSNPLITFPPYTEQHTQQSDDSLQGHDPARYLPSDEIKEMSVEWKKLIKSFQDPKDADLMSMIGESAPKEISPIMKLINALIPPRIVEATGYLQWHNNDRIGITFEFVGPRKQQTLMPRTIYHLEDKAAPNPLHYPSKQGPMNARGGGLAAKQQKVKIPQVTTDCYIDLLAPAMNWLVLTFWQYHKTLHVTFINRIFSRREKQRRAQLHYLLGALYYACSEQHPVYESFFWPLAVEHFHHATRLDPDWSAPYLYLATIYSNSSRMRLSQGKEHWKLFDESLSLYNQGINHTILVEKRLQSQNAFPLPAFILQIARRKRMREVSHARDKLIVAQELTNLELDSDYAKSFTLSDALKQILSQLDSMKLNLSEVDSGYLYNLARLYVISLEKSLGFDHPRKKGVCLLAYSLAHSPGLWTSAYRDKDLKENLDLIILEKVLESKRKTNPKLDMLKGSELDTEIDAILEEFAKRDGRLT
jgi:hypothetical protein